MKSSFKVSVIIPAHNEEDCIGVVVDQVVDYFIHSQSHLNFEVIVVDNGSTDATQYIAKAHGAKVVYEPKLGYGQACWQGIQASSGDVLAFVDGDGAVDIHDFDKLLEPLIDGADLVIGSRLTAPTESLTPPQRFGNRLACWLIRLIWRYPVHDLGPFRVLRRSFFDRLSMQDRGFGWTIEMQIRAFQLDANVVDVPVKWQPRIAGQSKISGTLRGVFLAGRDIIGMIFRQWWRQYQVENEEESMVTHKVIHSTSKNQS